MKTIYTFLVILSFTFYNSHSAQDLDFFEPKSTIGGYGELHYNQVSLGGKESTKTLDFHRFVLFYSHSWTEKWSFKAEVELEHNFVAEGEGELELEQAYVNFHYTDWIGFQAGVILPSVGLINELHEPPTYSSVERPDYNKLIIPTTWFGNGVAFYGYHAGFDYKVSIMEGLDGSGFRAKDGIRNGRQKGYNADASNLLYSARINYLGLPGILIGASLTYNNAKADSSEIPITLFELHTRIRKNNLYIDAEYGNISYSDYEIEKSTGYYVNAGYDVGSIIGTVCKIIPFIMYSNINTAAATITGGNSEREYDNSYWTFGISVLPINEVVFKADYSIVENDLTGNQTKLFNLGVGYMF